MKRVFEDGDEAQGSGRGGQGNGQCCDEVSTGMIGVFTKPKREEKRVELQENLGGPDPPDGFCETNVVCLEFIETDKNEDGCNLEDSHEGFPDAGDTVGREVINDA